MALKVSHRLDKSLKKIEIHKMAFQNHKFSWPNIESNQGQRNFPFPLASFQVRPTKRKSHLSFILRFLLATSFPKPKSKNHKTILTCSNPKI